jgi:hypothetical protein
MPENEELKQATHKNIRRTLFYSVWRSVKYMEFRRLRSPEDYYELQHPIEDWEEGLFDRFVETYVTKEKATGRLLATQKWTVDRNGNSKGVYKVKFYHMDDDEFRGKLYPMSYLDSMRYLWFTRKHFRIL